jgi:hypothetical protein
MFGMSNVAHAVGQISALPVFGLEALACLSQGMNGYRTRPPHQLGDDYEIGDSPQPNRKLQFSKMCVLKSA